jgi:hypothetical protein
MQGLRAGGEMDRKTVKLRVCLRVTPWLIKNYICIAICSIYINKDALLGSLQNI